MNRLTRITLTLLCAFAFSCASYNAYQKGRNAERLKNWDDAVVQYEKALDIDPGNMRYQIDLQRAKLEASRIHFEKGKTLSTAARNAHDIAEQLRLSQLAATELEVTVKLDSTNQYAAVELGKAIALITDLSNRNQPVTIDQIKKRASQDMSKAQPPQLITTDQRISLNFSHETPVKDIYRALANGFGINVIFDQALKDDRIAIDLKDVTAQEALERLMQIAGHFYKVLDEHTIIIVPDNPQARRDYEDLVIRTFYLSNGDAEQVTNVVRTMLEARNVFPLKALNAITIRDTADKVRIAEKIIEANDKAKAEVVVDVELMQLDLDKSRELGFALNGVSGGAITPLTPTSDKGNVPLSVGTINDLRRLNSGLISFVIPGAAYSALKSIGNSQLLANPELRISEGEKATLHIGSRIPVPVAQFTNISNTPTTGQPGFISSYQYQDVGIKVAIEPRVHHNREVTLKLTVEVSNQGPDAPGTGGPGVPAQPTFITRTIESTIRLKDGETNFLAGLIQQNDTDADTKTPFLGDIPVLGRLFTNNKKRTTRTDLILTMTPHIIRIPDITEEDAAPMWVGTQNNLSFRGLSPRLESQSPIDPFAPRGNDQFRGQAQPNVAPGAAVPGNPPPTSGSAPTNPFAPTPTPQPPQQPPRPVSQQQGDASGAPSASGAPAPSPAVVAAAMVTPEVPSGLSPRISPQPVSVAIKPGEEKWWTVVGMDLDGLTTNQMTLRYNPQTIDISEVTFGPALKIDATKPPVVKIDSTAGTITITSSDGNPLSFTSGGDVASLRVRGVMPGETFLVMDSPSFKNGRGEGVASAISGGRAKVE